MLEIRSCGIPGARGGGGFRGTKGCYHVHLLTLERFETGLSRLPHRRSERRQGWQGQVTAMGCCRAPYASSNEGILFFGEV